MKNIYTALTILSLVMMGGDSESFTVFMVWHIAWLAVALLCASKLAKLEESK